MVQRNLSLPCPSLLPIIHYISSAACFRGFPSAIRNALLRNPTTKVACLWLQSLVSDSVCKRLQCVRIARYTFILPGIFLVRFTISFTSTQKLSRKTTSNRVHLSLILQHKLTTKCKLWLLYGTKQKSKSSWVIFSQDVFYCFSV